MTRPERLRLDVGASLMLATVVMVSLPVTPLLLRIGVPRQAVAPSLLACGLALFAVGMAVSRIAGSRVLVGALLLAIVATVLVHCGRAPAPTAATRRRDIR